MNEIDSNRLFADKCLELIEQGDNRFELLEGLLNCCLYAKQNEGDFFQSGDWVKKSGVIKDKAWGMLLVPETCTEEVEKLYWDTLLFEAPYVFDSYLIYMERKRPYGKKFYEPRRITLKKVVDKLQYLEDSPEMYFQGVSMAARTGKSSTIVFFLSWIMGKRPWSHNAIGTHSGILAKHFYKEFLKIIDTEEYCYREVFPELIDDKGRVIKEQSAEEFTIQLYSSGDFPTMTCRGIDGSWTGVVDISQDGYLCIDDLVRDRQHSLSPKRMDDTFQEYLNKMVDRMNDGAKQLMIGTLWSVIDPLMRIENEYGGDPAYDFLKIPALDPVTDESNFQYRVKGFSTEYYRDMRDRLESAEWMAKYQQAPFVREGLLYPIDELRFFNGILPEGDSRVVAVVDVAWGGGDALSMPVGREYENGDVYIFDWVYNKGPKEATVPLVVGKIMANEIRQCRFEGNVGGAMYSTYVDEKLTEQGYKCACTEKKAPNKMSKMEKIIAYSGDVKRKFIFLDSNGAIDRASKNDDGEMVRYRRSAEYQAAMDDLMMFVTVGKNEHDDAPDSLTQLCMFVDGVGQVRQSHVIRGGLL